MEINLKLTLEDVNGIISVMAGLPFSQVHELIQRIRNQTIEQVELEKIKQANTTETEA